ncbi:uncharacterized protein LOC133925852 [Phragmites australis]|uniref:uncharacterized protein LOC133925852 n=1 Tax=Phragmites australis TaxID=29695 RepID=UPI002D7970C0|nr:uncharacterized protein LOC133925852 [Phragmites australis]
MSRMPPQSSTILAFMQLRRHNHGLLPRVDNTLRARVDCFCRPWLLHRPYLQLHSPRPHHLPLLQHQREAWLLFASPGLAREPPTAVKAIIRLLRECRPSVRDIAKMCVAYQTLLTSNLDSVTAILLRADELGVPRNSLLFRKAATLLRCSREKLQRASEFLAKVLNVDAKYILGRPVGNLALRSLTRPSHNL